MVIIEAGEQQFLQYQVVIVKLLFTRFINKQKNQIKSREKTGQGGKRKEKIGKRRGQRAKSRN